MASVVEQSAAKKGPISQLMMDRSSTFFNTSSTPQTWLEVFLPSFAGAVGIFDPRSNR